MKHMNRRILAVALAAVMLLGLLPTAFASAEEPEEQTPVTEVTEPAEETPAQPAPQAGQGSEISTQDATAVSTWADLQTAFNAGGDIVLGANITAGDSDTVLTVPADKTVTLDLAGHTIDRGLANKDAKDDGSVITVYGTLTVNDSSEGETGKITGGNTIKPWYASGVTIIGGGSFTLNGGSITGNGPSSRDFTNNNSYSGGVGYNLNPNDGFAHSITFIMTGGSISGNIGRMAGALPLLDYHGEDGGIEVPVTVRLLGGTIEDNIGRTVGGLYQYLTNPDSEFTVGGGIVIQNNRTLEGKTGNLVFRHTDNILLSLSQNKPLASGAKIGVTVADNLMTDGEAQFATAQDGYAAKFWQYFFADDSDSYKIGLKSGDGEADKLYFATRSDTTAVKRPHFLRVYLGQHTVLDKQSGPLEQWIRMGDPIATIIVNAEEGYCIDDYDYDFEGGYSQKRVSSTQLEMGGTFLSNSNAEDGAWVMDWKVSDAKLPLSVGIIPGTGMSKTAESGALEQKIPEREDMEPVVFTADKGYYFPENYAGFETVARAAESSGLTVKRDSDTQITVSGTPTEDVTLTLAAAVQKTRSVTITAGDGMEQTADSGGLTQTVAEGAEITPIVLKAKDGYYFPEDYKITVPDGLSVKRSDDGKTITISGTPKADLNLTLTAAEQKPDDKSEAPKKPTFVDGQGNVIDNPASYKKGETANAGGGLFDGWFDENGNELTDVESAKPGVTYTARWRLPDKATDTVKTGDAGVTLYIGLASAALLATGAAVLFAARKRREN